MQTRKYLEVSLLLALPWLLLLVNRNWLYTSINYMDPWIYQGYFNNLSEMITAFPAAYYGSRLAYILPGWLCYHLFPVLIANALLHIGFYYAAIFAIYGALKLQRSRWALITAIFMGMYPFFIGAMGWDYIDGAGIAYTSLTILMLVIAMKASRFKWLALLATGIIFGCALHTNLFLIVLVPFLLVYYRPFNVNDFTLMGIGILLITAVLGAVNVHLGGRFIFYSPTLVYAITYTAQPSSWFPLGWSWVASPWLILLVLVLISSIWQRTRTSVGYIVTMCLTSFLTWRNILSIQLFYYASYLIPIAIITLGEQVSKLSLKREWIVVGSLIVVMLVVNGLYRGETGTSQQLEVVYKVEQEVKDQNLYFWYSLPENQIYRAIACTHLWSNRLVAESFPNLESYLMGPRAYAKANIGAGMSVVVLSKSADILDEANRTLHEKSLRATLVRVARVDDINLTFINIQGE